MKQSMRLIAGALAGAVGLAACTPTPSPPESQSNECTFRTGDLRRSFCRHSMIQLLANPDLFFGKPIFTYGYLQLGPGGSAGLAPSPATFEANDTVGCIQVDSFALGVREASGALSQEGTYVVQIAGDFSKPNNGLCAGRLSNATISGVRRLDP